MTVPASRAAWPGSEPHDDPAGSLDRALARMRRVVEAQRDIATAAPVPATIFQVLAESVLTVFPADGAIASEPEGDFIVARATAGTTGAPPGHRIPRPGTLGVAAAPTPGSARAPARGPRSSSRSCTTAPASH